MSVERHPPAPLGSYPLQPSYVAEVVVVYRYEKQHYGWSAQPTTPMVEAMCELCRPHSPLAHLFSPQQLNHLHPSDDSKLSQSQYLRDVILEILVMEYLVAKRLLEELYRD